MIQEIFSTLCQTKYQTKFIFASNDYASIESRSLINWFYQKLLHMNIQFPWNLIGEQLDELNTISFLIQFTIRLILNNPWIFIIIFLLIFLFIYFLISSIKSFCKFKQNQNIRKNQSLLKPPSSWNNEIEEEKFRIYSHIYKTLQSSITSDHYSKKQKTHHMLYKSSYSIFLICLLLTSGLLLWVIIIVLKGISIKTKLRDYIQQSSLELISFMEHTVSTAHCIFNSTQIESELTNESVHINSQLNLAAHGTSFLTKIFNDLSIHLTKLEKLFDLWSITHSMTIGFAVISLLLYAFVFYLFLKKFHWSYLKSFQYTKFSFILSIIYWVGFILWFTKLVILLPHVAGACSACNDLKQNQVYNSLFFASKWFNSTFFSLMANQPNQLIENCKQNLPLWSINDLIHFGILENIDYVDSEDQYQYHPNYSKYEQYFGHCEVFYELHHNFTNLFCHIFVKHLLHYLITSIVTVICHFLLYLITNLLRRFIENHKYQLNGLNIAIRSAPTLAIDKT